jgi:hypothetical protein
MTVLDDVGSLVRRLRPHAICDDCITERLGLTVRQHANHKTRKLARDPQFDRRRDRCSICGADKLVISSKAHI